MTLDQIIKKFETELARSKEYKVPDPKLPNSARAPSMDYIRGGQDAIKGMLHYLRQLQ